MPIQVQRRPSETPLSPPHVSSAVPTTTEAQQQQQQHREALRLALGSILTPKRPPVIPGSRPTSGTATPSYPSPWLSGNVSGAQTPVGTPPPSASPYLFGHGHGPNSSEHLHHPHFGYPHHHSHQHPHPHPPSKLGRSSSTSNSPTESTQNSATASVHPSPRPIAGNSPGSTTTTTTTLPAVPDVEPLPPAMMLAEPPPIIGHEAELDTIRASSKPVRPSIMPLLPSKEGNTTLPGPGGAGSVEGDHAAAGQKENGAQTESGSATPRAKFLQTLQSKSAWDALIHGSFS